MSAEVLRRAAALMRERAEAATGPEWAEWHMTDDGRAEVFVPNGTMDTETVFEFKDYVDCEECGRPNEADLLHITSWHPAVALAVADWLEAEADLFEDLDTIKAEVNKKGIELSWGESTQEQALAVASAYLGEQP